MGSIVVAGQLMASNALQLACAVVIRGQLAARALELAGQELGHGDLAGALGGGHQGVAKERAHKQGGVGPLQAAAAAVIVR